MQIVFATTTATVTVGPGNHTTILVGEHWPASDPIVRDHPDLFTADPRYGLRVSGPLDEDAELEAVVDENWQKISDLGFTPEEAVAIVEAAATRKKLEEEKADAGQSQAPVEQATKAPGEKRTTRRG